ncbi:conserved hypothetical protein [Hyella patelloides LEGE 07179]|uniref:STAS/SEC14 domain-containing protein n=1 Tax=Hyella patelloides LEGE 07179 TaxID=945734 RepID=A0A563W3N4_9CYAN|nr:hypothetical protein [Hyella patelloides]VEP18294.1 conserved hypothetical protein [Hyella patelloides LEGE 07179]
MSQIVITEEKYPIIYVHFKGAATLENTQNFLARFSEWLSRSESFSLILRQTSIEKESVPAEESKKFHLAIAQWAKQNKPQIAQYCIGMAMVIDSPEALKEQQVKLPKTINSLFGCSGQAFATNTEAEEWIKS